MTESRLDELVSETAAATSAAEVRRQWEKAGAAGMLAGAITVPGTDEVIPFQDYLKRRSEEILAAICPDSAATESEEGYPPYVHYRVVSRDGPGLYVIDLALDRYSDTSDRTPGALGFIAVWAHPDSDNDCGWSFPVYAGWGSTPEDAAFHAMAHSPGGIPGFPSVEPVGDGWRTVIYACPSCGQTASPQVADDDELLHIHCTPCGEVLMQRWNIKTHVAEQHGQYTYESWGDDEDAWLQWHELDHRENIRPGEANWHTHPEP